VPTIVDYSNDFILAHYLPFKTVKKVLKKNNDKQLFSKIVELNNALRSLAKKHNNTDFLHPDPHLNNFLYNVETEAVIPIDPGMTFQSNLSFEEIDARNNLFFAYTLFDFPKSQATNYQEQFIASLSDSDKESMLHYNSKIFPTPFLCYYAFREPLAAIIRRRNIQLPEKYLTNYSREKNFRLNEIIQSYN